MNHWDELVSTPLKARLKKEESEKLKKLVETGIKIYNKYRSPESTAYFLRQWGSIVAVLFKGSFCVTCGINDWVEDLKYVLEDLGAKVELLEIIEPSGEHNDSRIGIFRVKELPENVEGEETN